MVKAERIPCPGVGEGRVCRSLLGGEGDVAGSSQGARRLSDTLWDGGWRCGGLGKTWRMAISRRRSVTLLAGREIWEGSKTQRAEVSKVRWGEGIGHKNGTNNNSGVWGRDQTGQGRQQRGENLGVIKDKKVGGITQEEGIVGRGERNLRGG